MIFHINYEYDNYFSEWINVPGYYSAHPVRHAQWRPRRNQAHDCWYVTLETTVRLKTYFISKLSVGLFMVCRIMPVNNVNMTVWCHLCIAIPDLYHKIYLIKVGSCLPMIEIVWRVLLWLSLSVHRLNSLLWLALAFITWTVYCYCCWQLTVIAV